MAFQNVAYLMLGVLLLHPQAHTSAIGFLTSVPEATEQVLTACPDSSISFTCSHNNTDGEQTEWKLPGAPPCLVLHRRPEPPACNPFIITMFSDLSGSSLTSTVQTNATESLDGSPVACLAGGLQTSPQVGNITIRVIGSPSVPTTGPIEYSVESATTGRVRFNVSSIGSFGTAVSYNASVVGSSGTVQVSGNTITVMGLNYTQMHSIMVTATSAICPGLGPRSINVPISFSIKRPMITQPVASIICCDQLLPIRVSWTVDPGTQTTTDPNVPLVPPPTATPTITYSSTGGRSGSTSSDSPFDFPNPDVEDTYTFTVSVANVAGPSSAASEISVSAISSDDSTVATSGRLTLNIESDCVEEGTSGNFSVSLEYGVGMCKTIADLQRTETVMETITSPSGVQISVGTTSAAQLCFNVTLLCNNRTVDKTSNLDFSGCPISTLLPLLGSEVTLTLSFAADNNGIVPHLTIATFSCSSAVSMLTGASEATCVDGNWMIKGSTSCSTAVWLIVVIVLLVLTLTTTMLVATGVTVYYCYKITKKPKDRLHQLGPVYEEPDKVNPDPHTEGNLAYGHVQHTGRQQSSQPPTELREQMYEEPENFKPDPHTQGNVAYGHVQFTQ